MAKFFNDKYKKYHDILDANNAMVTLANSIKSELESTYNELKNLSSIIGSSNWTELGKTELNSNYMVTLNNQFATLANGITTLNEAASTAILTTLVKLKSLKEKNQELDKIEQEISALGSSPKHNTFGSITNEYQDNENKLKTLTSSKNLLEENLKSLVIEIDASISKIDALKVDKIEVKAVAPIKKDEVLDNTKTDDNSKYVLTNQSNNYLLTSSMFVKDKGKMLDYGEYSVVKTRFPLVDYYNYIQKYKVYQKGRTTYECYSVSHHHAISMLLGRAAPKKGNLDSYIKATGGDVCYARGRSVILDDKKDALKAIYEDVSQGRPVSIDVIRRAGGRHVVTVVGFKSSVKGPDDLRSEDLLIMDSWDGQIERMDTSSSRIMIDGRNVGQDYKGFRIGRLNSKYFSKINNDEVNV